VVSDALHSYDALTGRPTSLATARELFGEVARFQLLTAPPASMPDAVEETAHPCYSCTELFVHIGMIAPRALETYRPARCSVHATERDDFPDLLRRFLPTGGLDPLVVEGPRPGGRPIDDLPPAGVTMALRYRLCLHVGSQPGDRHRVDDLTIVPDM